MATTTRATFRQKVSENVGDWLQLTTDGAGSTTTLVASTAINEDLGGDDDGFAGWWIIITDACACEDGEVRRVKRTSGYASSTGTFTVDSAFSGTPGSGVTFELHRYDPRIMHSAINRALGRVYPHIVQEVLDESLVVDNRLSNSDFETFSGGFTSWTENGSPTVTQETTRVKHGSSSAKVVAGGSAAQLQQAPEIDLGEIAGKVATAKFWCWASDASSSRINLDFSSETQNGDYHDGDNSWRLIEASFTVPDDATQVQVELETAAGDTAYWDAGWLAVGPVWRYTIPTSIRKGPYHVSIQRTEDYPEGPYDHIRTSPLSGRRLQLRGIGALSTLSSDTDTAEIDGPKAEAVSYLASQILVDMIIGQVAGDDSSELETIREINRTAYAEMISQPEILTPPLGAEAPSQKWHVSDNGGTRILHLNQRRPNEESFTTVI